MDVVILAGSKGTRLSLSKNRTPKPLITIGRENYKAIVIPPKVWWSFMSEKKYSLVVNCIVNKHSKNKIKTRQLTANLI
jgi:mannose-1-phosphate guanylyltransferase